MVAPTQIADHSEVIHPPHDLNAKWDACLDFSIRRFLHSSLAGAFGGLLFFRSPGTRWASLAFGAGVGIGSAYAECSYLFNGSSTKLVLPKISDQMPEFESLRTQSRRMTPSQVGHGKGRNEN
ncbi:MICOS complex subunit MIC10-like isoform X2 [Prosopis cineraria]|uniref:MICOS complex subunit MIC10-like isoform X2 n=1 Tax=Prosopis cineraria TaxID=364024 RepID=UPI00240EDCE3|nr:MICOS complex subunit MIC10-like isoform X2 [Prosopis cineraria]